MIQDATGTTYRTVPMPANGPCGFSCFAYSLTGDRYVYGDVVEDSLRTFFRNQRLFIERTEFAKSNRTLSVYQRQMRDAMANVEFKPVPSPLSMADGHLVAFYHMYDLTVFVYNCALNRWIVYGDTAGDNRGYICLSLNGEHFYVLQGVDAVTAAIPREAEPQVLSAERMAWQPVDVNSGRYSSPFVWNWPSGDTDCE